MLLLGKGSVHNERTFFSFKYFVDVYFVPFQGAQGIPLAGGHPDVYDSSTPRSHQG